MRVIGMLSGTSHDAVDTALAELSFTTSPAGTPGDTLLLRPMGLLSTPFPEQLRQELVSSLPPAATTMEQVCRLDTELGRLFGRAAHRALTELAHGYADLVVSHGQTCFHRVEGRRTLGTLQLGAAGYVAQATGLPVVSDLRTRDVACGGGGAPLSATLDALLLPGTGRHAALNLGGIANLTVRDGTRIRAYDLGPANALIDAATRWASGGAEHQDTGGARARRGTVDRRLLARLRAEPYYRLPAPKTCGKERFHVDYLLAHLDGRRVDPDAVITTVTELTALLVADACRAHRPTTLTVSGGGVRNPVLMSRIRALAAPSEIRDSAVLGLPAQAKEAYLFALLGFLTVHGLPGSLPAATGARRPALLGSLTPGDGPLRLPEPAANMPRMLRVSQE
ncbi:anhydro-N-acetylmuramic acid kinase [Streptomyces sp. 549]|uniref:anhydro-N-acetylmuramic acid kinase n=1 Tax=Streptomyces sp. 549 TaxID=3049076 RepID=UPI0024C40EF9|nr:anhydro-N-acetylmuramic acid kinase [Streptomyces sp. 549]MDK1471989.1 anhydro-N-acetylmuramic acid kinase [Streptomyces sp. 549]